MKILVCGLPGSGKTTLTKKLCYVMETHKKRVIHLNADVIRRTFNDWDFSYEGRVRQAKRMKTLSTLFLMYDRCDYAFADFVAPTEELRSIYSPDFTIWMNTIQEGRFEDTNRVFRAPSNHDIEITRYDYSVHRIIDQINSRMNSFIRN